MSEKLISIFPDKSDVRIYIVEGSIEVCEAESSDPPESFSRSTLVQIVTSFFSGGGENLCQSHDTSRRGSNFGNK